MDDREVMKMAAFKLGEAARRMRTLAATADDLRVRQLLMAVAQVLAAQQEEVRVALEGGLADRSEASREKTATALAVRPRATGRSKLRLAKGGRS